MQLTHSMTTPFSGYADVNMCSGVSRGDESGGERFSGKRNLLLKKRKVISLGFQSKCEVSNVRPSHTSLYDTFISFP